MVLRSVLRYLSEEGQVAAGWDAAFASDCQPATCAFATRTDERLISHQCGIETAELIPELDLFFGDIAGWSSSATRLDRRPTQELVKARTWLSKGGFFERRPQLAVCRDSITAEETPDLWRHMHAAEELRISLLLLLNEMNLPEG